MAEFESFVVDTSGRAIFVAKQGAKLDERKLNEKYFKDAKPMKVAKLRRVKRPRATTIYDVNMKGFS